MRFLHLLAFSLALPACGSRGTLEVATGSGGSATTSTTATTGYLQAECAPNDGPALALILDDGAACLPALSGFSFLISGADLTGLHPGSTLTVAPGANATTQGGRITGGQPVPMTGGTLTFTTLVESESASGSYDVTFTDGQSAAGTFTATWCNGLPMCG
jgi:hypothetical protein